MQETPSQLRQKANFQYEYWDLGESDPFPNLGTTSLMRVHRSLILCGGQMVEAHVINESDIGKVKNGEIQVVYRIKLPVGTKEMFERLSKYQCTPVDQVGRS